MQSHPVTLADVWFTPYRDREISTTDPNYMKWTQWIFLQLFKHGLASQANSSVNWCPALGTVLANEEVIDGLSERGNHPVIRQPIRQWMLKITKYAYKLNEGLALGGMDWPEGTLTAQKQWIGTTEGHNVQFDVHIPSENSADSNGMTTCIEVFTTRIDTLLGTTFIAIAPEHPLVQQIWDDSKTESQSRSLELTRHGEELKEYVEKVTNKADLERIIETSKQIKTGMKLHPLCYAIHPLTKERLPVYVAEYVLTNYGYGAVMGVPAHDQRDFDFAKQFSLPIVQVITSKDSSPSELELPYVSTDKTGDVIINSLDELNGKSIEDASPLLCRLLSSAGHGGELKTMHKIRDWLFSRQRYWGEPIPIYYPVLPLGNSTDSPDFDPRMDCWEHTIDYESPIPVDEAELPLKLPDMVDFQPIVEDGLSSTVGPEGCLGRVKDWRYFSKKVVVNGVESLQWYARETNTMPQWAGSCWYYLRYTDPENNDSIFDKEILSKWLPVDVYIGGQEHAVLHLLYARFWHLFLCDIGVIPNHNGHNDSVSLKEPFKKLIHQGMILGPDGEKMSKSRGNVISPDDIISKHGGDVLRVYEMFMGPLTATKPWDNDKIQGITRFLQRVYAVVNTYNYRLGSSDVSENAELELLRNKTVQKVTTDIENVSFNTAISSLMVYSTELQSRLSNEDSSRYPTRHQVTTLLLLLSPFAPHLAEEGYSLLHPTGKASVRENSFQKWPTVSKTTLANEEQVCDINVQINGKFRGKMKVENLPKDTPDINEYLFNKALENDEIEKHLRLLMHKKHGDCLSRDILNEEECKRSFIYHAIESKIKRIVYVPGKIFNIIC